MSIWSCKRHQQMVEVEHRTIEERKCPSNVCKEMLLRTSRKRRNRHLSG